MGSTNYELIDAALPVLGAGTYRLDATVTLSEPGTEDLKQSQRFSIEGPSLILDSSAIHATHPIAGATGQFGSTLAHVVLEQPTLPWEIQVGADGGPWLALVVFEQGQLAPGEPGDPTCVSLGTISDLRRVCTDNGWLAPDTKYWSPETRCRWIRCDGATLHSILPTTKDAPLLAHVRKLGEGPQAQWYSVVVANRIPAADRTAIVHLVSLAGLDRVRPESPLNELPGQACVLSLASWTFASSGASQTFRDVALRALESRGKRNDLELLSARSDANQYGFVPIEWARRDRTRVTARHRGPLLPIGIGARVTPAFTSVESVMAWDAGRRASPIDSTLAVAFQYGQLAAASDAGLVRDLLRLRSRARRNHALHAIRTNLSGSLPPTARAQAAASKRPSQALQMALSDHLATTGMPAPTHASADAAPGGPWHRRLLAAASLRAAAPSAGSNPRLLGETDELTLIRRIGERVADALKLGSIPFSALVPVVGAPDTTELALPSESMRCFRLDNGWLHAFIDGAVSLGRYLGEGLTDGDQTIDARLHDQAWERFLDQMGVRARGDNVTISGLFIRSSLVEGWPAMSVRAFDGKRELGICRRERLAPNLLMIWFESDWTTLTLQEPAHGLRFVLPAQPPMRSAADGIVNAETMAKAGGSAKLAAQLSSAMGTITLSRGAS